MVDRLMALVIFWGMRCGVAWVIADQYAKFVNEKLVAVSRAFNF
ncbi:hypothetical protein [Pseudolabrys sp.]|jgi:hypothetical protein